MTAQSTRPATPRGGVRFNPFGADFRRDPYPIYERLREARPVHKTLGMWVLTRHRDVRGVLHDRTFSAGLIPQLVDRQAGRLPLDREQTARVGRLGTKSLVFTDNPEHARLRGLVNRVFSGRAVARLRPRIAAIAEELIERAWAQGGMDVIGDLAAPLPERVMCDWMGLPPDLCAEVGGWTHDIRYLLEPGLMQEDDLTRVCAVVETFAQALDEVIRARRNAPGDDLISDLLAARTAGGDGLEAEELAFVCIMCFVAGNETTKSLIGNGVLALFDHPAQAGRLRRSAQHAGQSETAKRAVDEALRYDCRSR
ncbi:cytochrome P450 [Actinomadura sp. CNU-125]|uniref:cytochrome P450 n=1 Tax=Actinomadura sp. CNU-125 TaxID=1904961 RepID=UPI000A56DE83|nr:cytochrome P450 [Actinomadura sp. CNU-125]